MTGMNSHTLERLKNIKLRAEANAIVAVVSPCAAARDANLLLIEIVDTLLADGA